MKIERSNDKNKRKQSRTDNSEREKNVYQPILITVKYYVNWFRNLVLQHQHTHTHTHHAMATEWNIVSNTGKSVMQANEENIKEKWMRDKLER